MDRATNENSERDNKCRASSAEACINLSWDKQFPQEYASPVKIASFEIKFRVCGLKTFQNVQLSKDENKVDLIDLKSNTSYEINVYWCDEDGTNTILFKKECTTKESKVQYLMENASADKTRTPFLYYLKPAATAEYPLERTQKHKTENGSVVDRIRVLDMIAEYRPSTHEHEEKTLLLLGATGTGKSTLIDALINYIAGVSFNDGYRFGLICKTAEEKEREDNQTQSQTSSVTTYRIPRLQGIRVDCGVNIIDTPGFNDTRENFDERITNQIQTLFEQRIGHLDAVLIVVPLSTTRLTKGQQYVFSSIMRLFGEDIERNIFVAITHDDLGKTTCLSVLKESNIPFTNHFRFNNASLLSEFSLDETKNSTSQAYWNSRTKSFSDLFKELESTPKTTVKSSVSVMQARTTLEIQLIALEEKLSKQAQIIANYKKDKSVLDAIKIETQENKVKCIYKRTVPGMEIKANDYYALNCPKCRKTCHKNCWVLLESLKGTCIAFKKAKCVVCPAKCDVNVHVFEKKVYVEGFVEKLFSGKDIVKRQTKREASFSSFQQTLQEVEKLIKELESKALKKDVLTLLQYVEDLTNRETVERKHSFEMRIPVQKKILEHLKKNKSICELSMDYLLS